MSEDKRPEHPPAFPHEKRETYEDSYKTMVKKTTVPGMTLRDYFAAKAMQALIQRQDRLISETTGRGEIPKSIPEHAERISKEAGIFADAMLKERSK